eukprot:scaffold30567_cov160-Skeletonema_menzelii.AAC.1
MFSYSFINQASKCQAKQINQHKFSGSGCIVQIKYNIGMGMLIKSLSRAIEILSSWQQRCRG